MLMPIVRLLAFALAGLLCAQAFAQEPRRIRGDVVALDGLKLQVLERSGERLAIDLDGNYGVTAVVRIDIAAIKQGSYVGTATMPQPGGTLRSLEVVVFPESGRGSGEGHYPWDLRPGSMMTNATVAQIAEVGKDRRMTLKYKDGEKVVTVPADAPIVTLEPGDRALVKPGAHVLFSATPRPDGTLTAARLLVGKDGLVPPM
ncbi:MAG TPA: hypothetical protein VF059_07860 [Casimicrobiaceae bacterium]